MFLHLKLYNDRSVCLTSVQLQSVFLGKNVFFNGVHWKIRRVPRPVLFSTKNWPRMQIFTASSRFAELFFFNPGLYVWLIDWMHECVRYWSRATFPVSRIDTLKEWKNDWLKDWVKDWYLKCKNEICKKTNEWMKIIDDSDTRERAYIHFIRIARKERYFHK